MNTQKMHDTMEHVKQQSHKECIVYFNQNPVWRRVFAAFREKYRSYGRFAGRIVIKNLKQEEIEELEGFFGQNFHGQKSVTISAEKFEKALSGSRYEMITPEEILISFFGEPLLGKAEEKAQKEQQIKEIEDHFQEEFKNTPAENCMDALESIIKRSDLPEWKRELWLSAKLYNALPYRTGKNCYLAVFAAAVTGNPHAFDHGTADGRLLDQVIQIDLEQRKRTVETSELFPAYKRQKSDLLAGIMIDDISNYALLYHVRALKEDKTVHKGMEGFCQENDIVQVPLNVIAEWEHVECLDNEIYIVENPSVFAMICGEKSCMCMNGQPKLAGLIVLELLAKTNTRVYYSGDLDPEGLLIAQKLALFYPGEFHYWHMTVEDYKMCRSGESLSDRRKKMLDKITDKRLVPAARAIAEHGTAGYQENIRYETEK